MIYRSHHGSILKAHAPRIDRTIHLVPPAAVPKVLHTFDPSMSQQIFEAALMRWANRRDRDVDSVHFAEGRI